MIRGIRVLLALAALAIVGAAPAVSADGKCGDDTDVCKGNTWHCGAFSYEVCCCRKILAPTWPSGTDAPAGEFDLKQSPASAGCTLPTAPPPAAVALPKAR